MQKFSFLMYNFQEKEMLLVKKKNCVLLENKSYKHLFKEQKNPLKHE